MRTFIETLSNSSPLNSNPFPGLTCFRALRISWPCEFSWWPNQKRQKIRKNSTKQGQNVMQLRKIGINDIIMTFLILESELQTHSLSHHGLLFLQLLSQLKSLLSCSFIKYWTKVLTALRRRWRHKALITITQVM